MGLIYSQYNILNKNIKYIKQNNNKQKYKQIIKSFVRLVRSNVSQGVQLQIRQTVKTVKFKMLQINSPKQYNKANINKAKIHISTNGWKLRQLISNFILLVVLKENFVWLFASHLQKFHVLI